MQTIGLIGGMSWYSTVEYYRVINEHVAERSGGHADARTTLQSLDFAEVRECQLSGDWDRAGRLLAEAGQHCERSGAGLVLLCTNLMHRVADRARDEGWSQVGVLGTRWVMEEDFYVGRLARRGLEVLVPAEAERAEVDRIIFEELTLGRVEESSRATYVDVIAELYDAGAEAVVLGCTEIRLLVGPEDAPLPLLDSLRTHAEAAVDAALG